MRIGLVGRMHSGKGEVASHLVAAHGFHKLAFADPVKDASVAAINAALDYLGRGPWITRAILERDKAALRLMPQFIGTELGRQYLGDPDIWIDLMRQRIAELPPDANVVVDDCRFPNEAESLVSAGFVMVRVLRPDRERIESVRQATLAANPNMSDDAVWDRVDQAMAHPSETEIDRITPHLTIVNHAALSRLHEQADALVRHLTAFPGNERAA